jgi:dTDP-4-dehydrorhamnose reductase
MQIIGTGLSGLVGSRIVELNPQHQFIDLSLDTGHDILKMETLEETFKNNLGDIVLHLAAFTDTNAAWNQKGDKDGLCYQLNVVGTQNIVSLCQKYGKYLIHISTDFVFDGTKETPYNEEDTPNPLDWYGQTKYEAERVVLSFQNNSSIIRIALPYRSFFPNKTDAARKIITKLQNNEIVTMFTDQIITPTFIDDVAFGISKIIDKKPTGIYHLVGSSSQSPFDMAQKIAEVLGFNRNLIIPSSLIKYLKTPNVRPYAINDALSNQKFISEFGFIPKTLTEGLEEMKKQLNI